MLPSPCLVEPCPWVSTHYADDAAQALKLATQPPLLQALRQRLAANRHRFRLFDRDRYARDFEDAMARVWAAQPPRP